MGPTSYSTEYMQIEDISVRMLFQICRTFDFGSLTVV